MSEKLPPMTPSRVLDEYDIAGVPKKLIAEMRGRFAALEEEGEHPWRILVDEVSTIDTENTEEMEDIDANRLWVAQACAEVMIERNGSTSNDCLTWQERIELLKTQDDFKLFFSTLNISDEHLWNTTWMRNHFCALEATLRSQSGKFGSWKNFLDFYGRKKNEFSQLDKNVLQLSYSQQIEVCKSPSDFKLLFGYYEINGEAFRSKNIIRSKANKCLNEAILKRFKTWDAFLEYMGPAEINDSVLQLTYVEQVQCCATPVQFRELFSMYNISEIQWRNAGGLQGQCIGIYKAIFKRFKSWKYFIEFMGTMEQIEINDALLSQPLGRQVEICGKNYDRICQLLILHKVQDNEWISLEKMQKLNKRHLLMCFYNQFGSKDEFDYFMFSNLPVKITKLILELPTTKQVAFCNDSKEMLQLFHLYNITQQGQWSNSSWLIGHGYTALYQAITGDERFATWDSFNEFMNASVTSLTERLMACNSQYKIIELLAEFGLKITSKTVQRDVPNNVYYAIISDPRFESWQAFLDFMNPESIESDAQLDHLSNLNLEEAIALLGNDPYALKMYIQHAHAELDEVEIDRLVTMAFRNFIIGRKDTREQEYLTYPTKLPEVVIDYYPLETDESTLHIAGTAQGEFVYLTGVYTRKITVHEGRFSVTIPLKIGEENAIGIMAVDTRDTKNKARSEQTWMTIAQTQEPLEDVDALFILLDESKEALTEGIRKNPGRLEYFAQCTEQVLIKKFSRSFSEGEQYMEDLIAKTESATIRKVLNTVLAKFRKINRYKFKNVQEGTLLFFQKYCAYEIRQRMEDPKCPGVILGNDPGTGKTRTIQAAIADLEAGIISPNSVVSTWEDEAIAMLEDPDLLVMQNMSADIRKERLRTRRRITGVLKPKRYVTNREFLQQTDDKERFKLLGSKNMVLVHDEAHSRINETSKQSMGASMIDNCFQINITATPAKNAEGVRKMLRTLLPKDQRFASKTAFGMAFPVGDPQAMKVLNLLLRKYMIRFRKRDVMEEIDPTQSLSQQLYRLPRKEFVATETTGRFTMSEGQADAIYQMFLNWDAWSKKYDKYIPDDETSEEDRLRVAGALTRRHAMRQSINNPEYLGLHDKDAKAAQVKNIVAESLKEGRKVVIFCAYNAQANKYATMFKHLNPAVYTGETSKEKEKKDQYGKPMKFAREIGPGGRPGNWKLDPKGYPIEDPNGETMLALDYERIVFQNTADSKIIIATYQAGAVGTTFTAGKAMIFDDLPTDVVEAIQAEDRIQRIDPLRQTHAEVKYYSLVSQYPKAFLENMKCKWVITDHSNRCFKEFATEEKAKQFAEAQRRKLNHEYAEVPETAYDVFFEQGTYDQVHSENLGTQRKVFHLINDGIADDSILTVDQIKFKGFNGGNSNTI